MGAFEGQPIAHPFPDYATPVSMKPIRAVQLTRFFRSLAYIALAIAAASLQPSSWAQDETFFAAAPFDIDKFEQHISNLLSTINRDALATLPKPSDPSELPIFIVGMPRTGSTLVERSVHTHPDAFGADEFPAFHVMVNGLAIYLRNRFEKKW